MPELDELEFAVVEVQPFGTAELAIMPIQPMDTPGRFRLDRCRPFRVEPELAKHFSVERIRVGKADVLLPGPRLSCEVFSWPSISALLGDVPMCEVGTTVIVTVRNESAEPRTLRMRAVGRLEGPGE